MITQKKINAGGDVSGGDINKTFNYYNNNAPKTHLVGLIEELREKIGVNPEAAKFVESLISWINPKKTEFKRDLSQKLNDCGKSYLLNDAMESKERFSKQLKKTTFNPALQEIYACILGEIYTKFNHLIKPKIATSFKTGEIDGEIYNLAESITKQITNAPLALGIGITEIVGMLYFLTGNCHLEWDYNNAPLPSCD